MQYLYSGKIQIQNNYERQLFKFVPFKAPGFPLIAGHLEGSQQPFYDSIDRNLNFLAVVRIVMPRAPRTRIEQAQKHLNELDMRYRMS